MDQKIFHLGLSEPAMTLYLLLDGLHAEIQAPTIEDVAPLWSDERTALTDAANELIAHNIIGPEAHAAGVFVLHSPARWLEAARE